MKTYEYYIHPAERGEFRGDVREADTGAVIYNINGPYLFENGHMDNYEDIDGLYEYLLTLKFIKAGDELNWG